VNPLWLIFLKAIKQKPAAMFLYYFIFDLKRCFLALLYVQELHRLYIHPWIVSIAPVLGLLSFDV